MVLRQKKHYKGQRNSISSIREKETLFQVQGESARPGKLSGALRGWLENRGRSVDLQEMLRAREKKWPD